jgi:putative zinc finger/helix-turn-helix YgiT family protein
MNIKHCPACGSDQIKARGVGNTREIVAFKGLEVSVPGVQSTICLASKYVFTLPKQFDANVASARAAHVKQRSAAKASKGLLTGTQLRAMREDLGLTQKEASELFGGGPVAFSKYENEDVAQSVAMDRLIRLIHRMGPFGVQTLRAVAVSELTSEVS